MAKKIPKPYRSYFEYTVAVALKRLKAKFHYEILLIQFTQPAKPRRYTPDFVLGNDIIIEAKGRFKTADRIKHLLIKEQYPDLDIRFVFMNPNVRISKTSKTSYAKWCDKNGFKWAAKEVPLSWIKEKSRKQLK